MSKLTVAPREIITPRPPLTLPIPQGMGRNEFFNSAANLENLAQESGLLRTPQDWLLFRKLVGHSAEFDACVILDTSKRILDPLGRPVRRDQLSEEEKRVWGQMTEIIFSYMLEKYPDPGQYLLLCGEASLDATWPLGKPGVPSIRMIHNHFMVFPMAQLAQAPVTDRDNPNLTDSGHNTLFLKHLADVYRNFFRQLDLTILEPMADADGALSITGYPQGLPSWQVRGGARALKEPQFWHEYELILRGFLDFYRTFFGLVSSGRGQVPEGANFPDLIAGNLLGHAAFKSTAAKLRAKIIADPLFANAIRWRPAYKQIMYRDEQGRLIVTISQNSVGNAITELLGIVVQRLEDAEGFAKHEAALAGRLLEVRERLVSAGLGKPIATPHWPVGVFVEV